MATSQIVVVDGVEYEFPDTFTDAQIHDALIKNQVVDGDHGFLSGLKQGSTVARLATTNPIEKGGALDAAAQHVGVHDFTDALSSVKAGKLNEGVPKLLNAVTHLIGAGDITDLATDVSDVIGKAHEAIHNGDYGKALRHIVDAVPVLGNIVGGADKVSQNKLKEGFGQLSGQLLDVIALNGLSRYHETIGKGIDATKDAVKPYLAPITDPQVLKPAATLAIRAGAGAELGSYVGGGIAQIGGALLGSDAAHTLPALFTKIYESVQRAKGKGPRPPALKPGPAPNWSRIEEKPESVSVAPKPAKVTIRDTPVETTPKPASVVIRDIPTDEPQTPPKPRPAPNFARFEPKPEPPAPKPASVTVRGLPEETPDPFDGRSNPTLKPKPVAHPSVKRAKAEPEPEVIADESYSNTVDFTPTGEPTTPSPSVNPSVPKRTPGRDKMAEEVGKKVADQSLAVDNRIADHLESTQTPYDGSDTQYHDLRKKVGANSIAKSPQLAERKGHLDEVLQERGIKVSETPTPSSSEIPDVPAHKMLEAAKQLRDGAPDADGKVRARIEHNGQVMMWEKGPDGLPIRLR